MNGKEKLHILVMTATWQSGLACIQSFGRRGHTLSILGNLTQHPNCASIFIKNYFWLSKNETHERAKELNELIQHNKIDLAVPISDEDALVVAVAKELRPDSKAFVISPVESVAVARSRNKTTELCNSLKIPSPRSIAVTRLNAASAANIVGYPCFLKLSGTAASQGVFNIFDEENLFLRLNQVPDDAELQLQENISGDFVGITGYAEQGKLIESFAFKLDYEHSHGGTPPYSYEVNDAKLNATLSDIAKALNWSGGIDIDLLQDKNGNYFVLEINPRLSGTIIFPLKLGIDLPNCYITSKLGLTESPPIRPPPPKPRRFVSLTEETLYLRRIGAKGLQMPEEFRSDNLWTDNAFWDDWRYSAALFDYHRMMLLFPKKR